MADVKKYTMDMTEANNTLQNIFDACDVSHNTVPFDKIVIKQKESTRYIKYARILAIVFLILVVMSPLCFKNDSGLTIDYKSDIHTITVIEHQLYNNSFVMRLNGKNIDYNNIFAIKSDGAIVYPTSVDETTGSITLPYDGSALSITITDFDGHTLNAVLAERK